MYSIKTGQRPVAIVNICLVSTADICPVSTADIFPDSTEDICPVSTTGIWASAASGTKSAKIVEMGPEQAPGPENQALSIQPCLESVSERSCGQVVLPEASFGRNWPSGRPRRSQDLDSQ